MPATPDRDALIAGFRRLRPVIHAWLDRDLSGMPGNDPTRAYADLTLAFGFARLGAAGDARACVIDAEAILAPREERVHDALLRAFVFRINEALAGRPHGSLLPVGLLPDATRGDQAGQLELAYTVQSLVAASDVLDPFRLIDPYRPMTGDPQIVRMAGELQSLTNPVRLSTRLRELIAEKTVRPELTSILWANVFGFAAVAGHDLVAELLLKLPAAIGTVRAPVKGRDQAAEFGWYHVRRLLAVAFERAATLPDAEHFPPLVDVVLELLRTAPKPNERHEAMATVGWPLLGWFRATGERDAAALFLHESRDLWPCDDEVIMPPTNRVRDTLGAAFRARLAHAVFRSFVGQPELLASTLPAMANLLTAAEYGGCPARWEQPGPQVRFATEFLWAVFLDSAAPALEMAIRFLERLPRLRGGFTTSNWYARVHFQIAEAVVLAFPVVGDF